MTAEPLELRVERNLHYVYQNQGWLPLESGAFLELSLPIGRLFGSSSST